MPPSPRTSDTQQPSAADERDATVTGDSSRGECARPAPGPRRGEPGRSGALTRAETRFQQTSNLLVGVTGLVYGWMRYFGEPADEWAVVNHPWQPDVQHLHVLTAPLLVFAVGLLWRDHVWGRIRRGVRARRRTGLTLALSFLPMAASGYLVQVATDETWTLVWAWVHGLTSCLWIAAFLVHQLARRRAQR